MGEHRRNPVVQYVEDHPGFAKLSFSERKSMKRKAGLEHRANPSPGKPVNRDPFGPVDEIDK